MRRMPPVVGSAGWELAERLGPGQAIENKASGSLEDMGRGPGCLLGRDEMTVSEPRRWTVREM